MVGDIVIPMSTTTTTKERNGVTAQASLTKANPVTASFVTRECEWHLTSYDGREYVLDCDPSMVFALTPKTAKVYPSAIDLAFDHFTGLVAKARTYKAAA